MKLIDAAKLALQNLWARRGRSWLNLLGVVISCVLLTMTFAGTRGASDGIMDIINTSDQTRQFLIVSSHRRDMDVPAEAVQVENEVESKRKSRIEEILRKRWIRENSKRIRIGQTQLEDLRSIEKVESVAVIQQATCRFTLLPAESTGQAEEAPSSQDSAAEQEPKSRSGSFIGVRPADPRITKRLLVGQMLDPSDADGVLIDEFTAYELGFRSDDQLNELLSREIEIRVQLGKQSFAQLVQALGPLASGLNPIEAIALAGAGQRLLKELDRTDLSEQDKQVIRDALGKLNPTATASKKQAASEKSPAKANPEHDDVEIDANGSRQLVRRLIIRGVVQRPSDDEDLFGFLQFVRGPRTASIYGNHREVEAIHFRKDGFGGFWNSAGTVAHVSDLREAVEAVESQGFATKSALAIVEKLETEVGKARLAIGGLAVLIMLVAAIGISNTMIVAVIERTPEFGIMKSLGASDRHVLLLVLLEGLVTGILGAILALLISTGLAALVSDICRRLIESRLKGTFDQQIFSFAATDILIVFFAAILLCTLASLIPAWRAAKLDPVEAMRR